MDLKFDKINVTVFLFTTFTNVLMVSRKDDHSKFGLPGGKVEKEDGSTINAAIRELKEETGIEVGVNDLFLLYAEHGKHAMNLTYVCHKKITEADIHTEEPHVVKIGDFTELIKDDAPFKLYNTMVMNSYINWLKQNNVY